jgi:CDGSH-type Zn-finger protein
MESKNEKRIKVTENGPYEVSGDIPLNQLGFVPDNHGNSLKYKTIDSYPIEDVYHLCRCGQSECKPFCDGTHQIVNFQGKETASHTDYEKNAKVIKGKDIDLMDAEELCAGARFCDTHGSTWHLVSRGTTQEEKDIAIQQCADCPSGRLTPIDKDGNKIEPNLPKEISILEDPAAEVHGPIWVKGGITVEDENGKTYPERNRVTLCRCGKSTNKPFCDGNHVRG